MNTLFIWLFIISSVGLIVGLIKPTIFAFALKQNANRKRTSLIFGVLAILFFILVAATDSTDIAKEIADFDSSEVVTVDIAETDDLEQLKAGLLVQVTLANVATTFVDARISTDVLLQTDFNNKSFEQWDTEYAEVMKKWDKANESIKLYKETISAIGDEQLSLIFSPKLTLMDHLIPTAYAELTRGEVLAIYDAAPPGQKLKVVGQALGVDARMAQDILADIRQGMNRHYGNIAKATGLVADGLKVVVTGSKVVATVGGIVSGAGVIAVAGMSVKSALAATIAAVGGADVVFDVAGTAVSIGMSNGDTKNRIAYILKQTSEGPLKQANTLIGIYDLTKAGQMLLNLGKISNTKLLDDLADGFAGNMTTVTGYFLPDSNEFIDIDLDKGTVTIAPFKPGVQSQITIKPVDAGTAAQMVGFFGSVTNIFAGFAEEVASAVKQLQADAVTKAEPTTPAQKTPTVTKTPLQPKPSTPTPYVAPTQTPSTPPPAPAQEPTPAPASAPINDDQRCQTLYGSEYHWNSGDPGYCSR